MAYRGEDLDLRSPSGRMPRDTYGTTDIGLNGSRSRGGAVYVDDTVLACCNHAHDIAQAHGAHEVRLEHLVHALTRVEGAAETLERRGIREAHLRRESAAVIAAEIPVGISHQSGPRASADFETVLRRASELSSGRGVPATVDDLLWVLLNFDRDNAAVSLLQRHALNWQQWEWPHRRERVVERVVERVAVPPPSSPPVMPVMPVYQSPNLDGLINRLDHIEQSIRSLPRDGSIDHVAVRLADMENSVRALYTEVSNDRRMLADLMRELRRDLSTPRTTDVKLPQSVVDRLTGVERQVEMRFDQLARSFSSIENRIDSLQRTPAATVSIPPQLFDRLSAIERALEHRGNDGSSAAVHAINDRLSSVEKSITSGMAEGARNWAALSERMKGFDGVLKAVQQSNGSSGGSAEIMLLAEQMQGAAGSMQNANDRLSALERIVAERFGSMERAATERQATLDKRFVEQTAHMERTLGDRL
ncbi:MAG: hypothetical protein RL291_1648, partial [Pseudomonadota bacterium]